MSSDTNHFRARRHIVRSLFGACALAALDRVHAIEAPVTNSLVPRAHDMLMHLHSRVLQPFLRQWPRSDAASRRIEPRGVAVLEWLPTLLQQTSPLTDRFVHALWTAARSLAWRQSYSTAQVGEVFLQNYGWTELMGLTGATPSEHLACGVLALGPNTTYPPHRHEAEEIYVPLAGAALWQQAGGPWEAYSRAQVIRHAPYEVHAMRTEGAPLLALYLWRSENLAQKSQLVAETEAIRP